MHLQDLWSPVRVTIGRVLVVLPSENVGILSLWLGLTLHQLGVCVNGVGLFQVTPKLIIHRWSQGLEISTCATFKVLLQTVCT